MNPARKGQTTKQPPRALLCFAAAFSFITLVAALCFPYGLRLAGIVSFGTAALLAAGFIVRFGRRYLLAAVGGVCGALWFALFCAVSLLPSVRQAEGWHLFTLEALSYAEGHTSYGTVTGRILSVDGTPARGQRAEVFLRDGSPDAEPGQVLRFYAEGQLNTKLADGCFVRLAQDGAVETSSGKVSLRARLARWSHALGVRIDALLDGDEAALCQALLTGERGEFSPVLQRSLSLSGAAHIASVSGMHVSVLTAFCFAVFGKRLGAALSVPLLIAFAALTGFSPSVLRAVIMAMMALLAFALRREADTPTSLFLALMLLLAANPFSALSVSLQLSFAATLGLVLFAPAFTRPDAVRMPKQPWLRKIARAALGSVGASLGALAFSMPVSALYFSRLSTVSLLTNLLILWAVSLSMMLAIPILALSFVWLGGAVFVARWLLWPALAVVTRMTKFLASLPLASAKADNVYLWIVLCVLVPLLFLVRAGKLSLRRGALVLAVVFAACTAFGVLEHRATGELSVVNADGAAVLVLRTGEGTLLVNCGKDGARSVRMLDSALFERGVTKASLLLTKNDFKTAGGLSRLRASLRVAEILRPQGDELWYDMPTDVFDTGGALQRQGAAVALIPAGDAYAVRITAGSRTMLYLCGVQPINFFVSAAAQEVAADTLVVDAAYYQSGAAMARLYAMTGARSALCADDGYESIPAQRGGISLVALSRQGAVDYLFKTR